MSDHLPDLHKDLQLSQIEMDMFSSQLLNHCTRLQLVELNNQDWKIEFNVHLTALAQRMLSSTSGEPCLGLEPAPNSGLVSILRLFLDRGGTDRIAIEVEYQSSKKYCFIPLLMCFAPDEFCLSDRFTV